MNQVEIKNAQFFKINDHDVLKIAEDTLAKFAKDNFVVEISFVSADEIKEINRKFRQIDHPTDVLSFPQIELPQAKTKLLGEIVISKEIVDDKNENLDDVIKHGILHLLGYDHEMEPEKWDEAAKIINCAY